MSLLSEPLLQPVWVRLAISALALIWLWKCASWRVHRGYGRVPSDLAWLATSLWVAAGLLGTAMVLGTLGSLTDWAWLLAVLAAGAGLRFLPVGPDPAPAPADPSDAAPSRVFLVVLGGYLIGRAMYSLRNPPADIDSLTYHLPMMAHWLQSGTLGVPMRVPAAVGAYYPGNAEILQLWAIWSTGRETLIPWPGIALLGAMAVALRRIALMAGARASVAEAASLCFVAAPVALQLTFGTRIDNVVACWVAIGLMFALRYRDHGVVRDLGFALLSLGLAAGAKGTGPGLALLVLVATLLGTRRPLAELWGQRMTLAVAALIGGYWMLRNTLLTWNPLFPVEIQIGPWVLPGLTSREFLSGTTQLGVWRAGYQGHLTLPYLWHHFGPSLVLTAIGVELALLGRASALASRPRHRGSLLAVAIGSLALFLISPFSGASWPAGGGSPPEGSSDNLRYLMPMFVALVPLSAAGLSALPEVAVVATFGALFLGGLQNSLGHILPGIVLVWAVSWLWSRVRAWWLALEARPAWGVVFASRAVALGTVTGAVALAVVMVEPMRERISDQIWDGYLERGDNFPAASIREMRREAAGRPIALSGVPVWSAWYGRDFSGRPVYVPRGASWTEARTSYRFASDDLSGTDRARWLRNLEESGAAMVVLAPVAPCGPGPIERLWCASDTSRFTPVRRHRCGVAFLVRTRSAPEPVSARAELSAPWRSRAPTR